MTTAHVEIVSEVLKWSPAERVSLAEKLLESVTEFATEDFDLAWRAEIARRVNEVESGQVAGIPSHKVFSKARQAIHANPRRRLSPIPAP